MKELILLEEEIEVLKDLENNMDKQEILRDLKDYGLIGGISSDNLGFLETWLTVNGKQVLRQIKDKSILDNFEFELDFGLIKIKKK